jgi:ABC-type amino acid transport substrate-binding protein
VDTGSRKKPRQGRRPESAEGEDALGVKVEFVPIAWPQLMKDFESDSFDIAMGGLHIATENDSYRKIYAAWFD